MDVGDWLRSLGLGEYEAVSLENKIDAEVLADLTDGDLEKLGVSMGHRRRPLRAGIPEHLTASRLVTLVCGEVADLWSSYPQRRKPLLRESRETTTEPIAPPCFE